MPRYFVRLAYRGTHYRGWQRQSNGVASVQATIEAAGTQVQRRSGEGGSDPSPVKIVGCGRTDAGVHASDYYLHFDTQTELRENWLFIMNLRLPEDIVLYEVWPVEGGAHVRYDAVERQYDYYIHTQPDPFLAVTSSLYPIEDYDFEAIERVLTGLVGRHDFRAFCLTPDRHNTTVCDLRKASLHREGAGRYRFRFVADRFLRGMIRILVFQLLRVGAGTVTPGEVASALVTGRRLSVGQARPEGLMLSGVRYGTT